MKKKKRKNKQFICLDHNQELSWVRVIVLLNLLLSIATVATVISFQYADSGDEYVHADDHLSVKELVEQTSFINDSRVRGVAHGRGVHIGLLEEDIPHIEVILADENEAVITAGKDLAVIESQSIESKDVLISELSPGQEYHVYLDSYRNHHVLTANENGEITFHMSGSHHVAIMQLEDEILQISNLTNGEDCTKVGDWDREEKKCTLFRNITRPIQIDSSGITLDCNDYTLIGNQNAVYSIFIPQSFNVKVQNCRFQQDSLVGVGISGGSNSLIDSNTFDDKRYGILISNSINAKITDNQILPGTKYGISSYQAKGNLVESNQIDSSIWGVHAFLHDDNGIYSNNTFEADSLRENGGAIYVHSQSTDNTFQNNKIAIDGHGFLFEKEADNNKVLNNSITANSGSGIILARESESGLPAGKNIEIRNNIIRAAGIGILATLSDQLIIESNRIHHAGEGGVLIESSDGAMISRNRIHDNEGNGITIFGSPTTKIWRNDIWVNQHYGLFADSPLQLSDEEIGNWWGGDCSKGLFSSGIQTNREDLIDEYPFKNAISLNPNKLVARPCG